MRRAERTVELEPRPESAGQARRVVMRMLRDAEPAMRDVCVLLTSELVTNALLYANGSISLQVSDTGGGYRISVSDSNTQDVGPKRVGPEASSGRGLALVDRLSGSWGVDVTEPTGKKVWFEVPRAS